MSWRFVIGIALSGLCWSEPISAANYDGNIYFDLSCRRFNGEWYKGEYNATVLNGKFADRRDFKRGEVSFCRNHKCWTTWEGAIKDDGSFKINIRENDYVQVSDYVSNWTLVGKFSSNDLGTAKVVKFPKDWQSKCKDSIIRLIEPASDSLAARSAPKSDDRASAETESVEPNPLAAEKSRSIIASAKLLLETVDGYAKSSSPIPNVIAVAEGVSKLKGAIKRLNARPYDARAGLDVESLTSQLASLLAGDAEYAKFATSWKETKK